MAAKFCERLHTQDSTYGAATWDVEKLVNLQGIRAWSAVSEDKSTFPEVGCGKGNFGHRLSPTLKQTNPLTFSRIAMPDLVGAERNGGQSLGTDVGTENGVLLPLVKNGKIGRSSQTITE